MPLIPLLTFGGSGGSTGTDWFDGASLIVEFGWAESMTAGTISWEDESDRVLSIDIRRGRATEYDFFPAGELRLRLDNADRRFDPSYASSVLYPTVVPGVQVRVRMVYSSTSYDLFRGQVESYAQGRDRNTPTWGTVIVTAADARGWLARKTLLDCPLAVEIAKDSPGLWFRLGEQDGTAAHDSGSMAKHGTHAGLGTYNYRQGLPLSSIDGAIEFVDGTTDAITLPSLTLTPPFTVTAQVVIREADRVNPIMSLNSAAFVFKVNADNYLEVSYSDGADTRGAIGDTTTLATDTVYTVSCVVLANAAPKLYVDTTNLTVTASGSGTLGAITGTGYLGSDGGNFAKVLLDEVTYFGSDKQAEAGVTGGGSTRLDDFFDARRDAWDEDTWGGTLSRVEKVLDSVGWPSARYSVTDYTPRLVFAPADLGENNAAAYLDEIANSEGGYWFVAADGTVTGHDRLTRASLTTSTASQGTISDDPTEAWRYEAITTDGTSSLWMKNRVRARRPYGSVIEAKDSTSVTTYGELLDDLGSLMLRTDADVKTRVDARLAARKDPVERITALMWQPRAEPSTFPKVALEIGNRITVETQPYMVGSRASADYFIEGIEHTIDAGGTWIVTWRLSPA